MKINGNTILITGGATGIGFALAEAFVREDNEVIICGRREHKLREAKSKLPKICGWEPEIIQIRFSNALINSFCGNLGGYESSL